MNDIWLFVVGVLIFAGYMYGLLNMINRQHGIQAREQSKYDKNLGQESGREDPSQAK